MRVFWALERVSYEAVKRTCSCWCLELLTPCLEPSRPDTSAQHINSAFIETKRAGPAETHDVSECCLNFLQRITPLWTEVKTGTVASLHALSLINRSAIADLLCSCCCRFMSWILIKSGEQQRKPSSCQSLYSRLQQKRCSFSVSLIVSYKNILINLLSGPSDTSPLQSFSAECVGE